MVNKVYGLLGISSKAKKIVSGTDIILELLNKNKIALVLIAKDASEKTLKNMKYYCDKANVTLIIYGTIDENSKAIGKHNRAIIGVLDENLADAIKKEIYGGENFGEN